MMSKLPYSENVELLVPGVVERVASPPAEAGAAVPPEGVGGEQSKDAAERPLPLRIADAGLGHTPPVEVAVFVESARTAAAGHLALVHRLPNRLTLKPARVADYPRQRRPLLRTSAGRRRGKVRGGGEGLPPPDTSCRATEGKQVGKVQEK